LDGAYKSGIGYSAIQRYSIARDKFDGAGASDATFESLGKLAEFICNGVLPLAFHFGSGDELLVFHTFSGVGINDSITKESGKKRIQGRWLGVSCDGSLMAFWASNVEGSGEAAIGGAGLGLEKIGLVGSPVDGGGSVSTATL
jgi:hypothetical protein